MSPHNTHTYHTHTYDTLFHSFTGTICSPRSASTLPMSVVKTPLPPEPSRFSPEMQKYLLSPEVVDLLRNKPPETVPAGLPLQEALVQKGLAGHTFSYPNSTRNSTASSVESLGQHSCQDPFSSDRDSVDYSTHYDVPPRSSNRAQLLSNNYMVPRLARASDPLLNYDILPPTRPAIPDGGHTHYDYLPKRDIPLPPRCDDVGGASIYDVPPPPRPLIHTPSMDMPAMDTPSIDTPTIDTPTSRSHSIDSTDCPPLLPPPQIIFRRDSKHNDNEMIPNKMYDMVWAGQDEFSLLPSPPHELEETLTDTSHRPYVNLCVSDMPPPVNRALKPGVAPPTIDRNSKPSDRRTSIEDTFYQRELPRLTSHSVHYTQVAFDRKKPVPTPRTNRTPSASPQRVNYCYIDINATNGPTLTEMSPKDSIDSSSL